MRLGRVRGVARLVSDASSHVTTEFLIRVSMTFGRGDFIDNDDESLALALALSAEEEANAAAADELRCMYCNYELGHLAHEERQSHYESHLNDDDQPDDQPQGTSFLYRDASDDEVTASSSSMRLSDFFPSHGPASSSQEPPPRENVFWHAGCDEPPPYNFSPGLINVLQKALQASHAKGTTRYARLCSPGVCHVATERWDMGWGCGYRNFLMACSSLLAPDGRPDYAQYLKADSAPGVRNLQRWIEDAWSQGFDGEGAAQLKHRLVGTRKWIGAGELYVAFTARGIPVRLVDFPNARPEVVQKWVLDYFNPPESRPRGNAFDTLHGANPVVVTERPPLVLQHAGHSRTIIGVEVNRQGAINLLLFDPSRRPSRELRDAGLDMPARPRQGGGSPLKRVLAPLQKRRRGSDSEGEAPDAKRPRADLPPIHAENPLKVINFFRLNEYKLGRNSKYQILYFPLEPPLVSKDERLARRVVVSDRIG